MCALIYTKLTDKTTVLSPREGACRKFNFGDDWTEMRLGMFCVAVAASGSNVNNIAESMVPPTLTDHVTFGIKDDSQTYPGQLGSLFLGLRDGDAAFIESNVNTGIGASGGQWRPVGYYGTTEVLGAAGAGSNRMGAATASAASAYNGFIAVKIVINNRGLSSQTVTMSYSTATDVAGTDYSPTALRTLLNNATYTALATIAWNDGAAARAIPDCIWVRTPLFLNSIRISCVRAIRYAP